jgi:hypothetical protein
MEEQAGNLSTAVSIFKLSNQMGQQAASRPAAAKHATLPAPRKLATIHQHPANKGGIPQSPAKAKTTKSAVGAGEEWTEF